MRLHELQQAIGERALDRSPGPLDGALLDRVDGRGLAPTQRLQIYRNNCLISLTEALRATFPTIERLVGEGFFRTAAAIFVRARPPREARLSRYGAEFPAFLADYRPAASLVYLPDVGRLEWAINMALHAADLPALAPADLAQAAEAMTPLRLHPACHLLRSPWPIERIWRANRPGADADADIAIDLEEGGGPLLVYRQGFDLALASITEGEFALLSRFHEGASLEAAAGGALAADPALDLAAALAGALGRGCLVPDLP
ncbi:MAG TPA: DNA-binding domain-containing protein [Hypericibacter adhaerens]|jgi:hypothetical protein|uniref:DNA-binding domain-containing protein n=1 Tax=Hypericibacter adhaerens TaxID=2602016 RepID=UPI002CA29FA5|nr:DNA-binding domain-containing protein [Hypericibacter adhaerens]HWA44939.1 DNA-binding domain-containing protein [Hypericibacter adhaerens]